MLPEKSGLVQATLCRGATSKHLSNRRESTLGSPLRENRTAGFAWGFGHKGEILRPNSTNHNIDHQLLMRAIKRHTDCRWVILYIGRWLIAPVVLPDGQQVERDRGVPQGGVVSPLCANLFLHYALDRWVRKEFPKVTFERYADDAIYHCKTRYTAERLIEAIRDRLAEWGLLSIPAKLSPNKLECVAQNNLVELTI